MSLQTNCPTCSAPTQARVTCNEGCCTELVYAPTRFWVAHVDKVPILSLEGHEICDPYTPEEVVSLYTELKERYEELAARMAGLEK